MINKRTSNPLKKRRVSQGYTQTDMSNFLEITQSQYSRIEKGNTDPTKYLKRLGKILDCNPDEIFAGDVLNEIEEEWLKDPNKIMGCQYHEAKPDAAYLEVKGWFSREELVKLIEFVDEGLKAKKT